MNFIEPKNSDFFLFFAKIAFIHFLLPYSYESIEGVTIENETLKLSAYKGYNLQT
jgi:hypothetical protein